MRWRLLTAANLVLAGCNSQVVTSTDTAAPPVSDLPAVTQSAQITSICVNHKSAILVGVGWATCDFDSPTSETFAFIIGGDAAAKLQPGSKFEIGNNIDSLIGERIDGPTETALTSGAIMFSTFNAGTSANGSFDVTFPGGAGSGDFSAEFCAGFACH